jgi:gamma-glutamyltranspeptidase/glutathione hydrolase
MPGIVAAGHPVTAEAAATILREGGNAFDAAIAALVTACVAEPVLASLGGGGFLLAQPAHGGARVFDFFTHTPRQRGSADAADFRPVLVDFGSAQQEFHIGLGASAVPGCVGGIFAAHRALGSMPLAALLQPAVGAARDGVMLNAMQGFIFRLVEPIYLTPSAAPFFASHDDPDRIAGPGDTLRSPQFADFLEVLAGEGEDLFYRGEVAASVARLCADNGGFLTRDDFVRYEVMQRRPLMVNYRGARLLTNPPPGSGGLLIAFGLGLLESVKLADFRPGELEHRRIMIEVMRQTQRARLQYLLDSDEAGRLLSEASLQHYRRQFADAVAVARGTTHISVADAEGNLASVTVSNGEGCGVMIPGTGNMLNNMLGEADLNPRGFHCWPTDRRMSSMMAPSVLQFADGGRVVTGSGGSNRIRTVLLQLITNLVDYGMDVESAVTASRLHIEDDLLNIEGGTPPAVVDALVRAYPQHRLFDGLNLFFGGAHTAARDAGGGFQGAGDPRRDGVCLVVS